MIISSPNFLNQDGGAVLTPAMVRGFYLIWRSGLQSGFSEIRQRDNCPAQELSPGTSEISSGTPRREIGRHRACWTDALFRTGDRPQDPSLR